jgi:hypothetical protein
MLTHIQIASARPMAKRFNLVDARGLYLTVQPNGSKLWRLNYRYLDRQKTLHIGPWPDVSLAAARARRDEARGQIAAGLDPAQEKKLARIHAKAAAAHIFKDVAEEWLAKCGREGRAEVTLDKLRWLLGMAYPLIGSQPINSITPTEALDRPPQSRSEWPL